MCVCVREREGEGGRERERERSVGFYYVVCLFVIYVLIYQLVCMFFAFDVSVCRQ